MSVLIGPKELCCKMIQYASTISSTWSRSRFYRVLFGRGTVCHGGLTNSSHHVSYRSPFNGSMWLSHYTKWNIESLAILFPRTGRFDCLSSGAASFCRANWNLWMDCAVHNTGETVRGKVSTRTSHWLNGNWIVTFGCTPLIQSIYTVQC